MTHESHHPQVWKLFTIIACVWYTISIHIVNLILRQYKLRIVVHGWWWCCRIESMYISVFGFSLCKCRSNAQYDMMVIARTFYVCVLCIYDMIWVWFLVYEQNDGSELWVSCLSAGVFPRLIAHLSAREKHTVNMLFTFWPLCWWRHFILHFYMNYDFHIGGGAVVIDVNREYNIF